MSEIEEIIEEYENKILKGCGISDYNNWTSKAYRKLKELEKGQTFFKVV